MAEVRIYGDPDDLERKAPELLAEVLAQLGPHLRKAGLPGDFEPRPLQARALDDIAKAAGREYKKTLEAMLADIGEVLDAEKPVRKGVADSAELDVASSMLASSMEGGYAYLEVPLTVPGQSEPIHATFVVVPSATGVTKSKTAVCQRGPVVLIESDNPRLEDLAAAFRSQAEHLLVGSFEAPMLGVVKAVFRELNSRPIEDAIAKSEGSLFDFVQMSETFAQWNPLLGPARSPTLQLAQELLRCHQGAPQEIPRALRKAAEAVGWEPEDVTPNLCPAAVVAMVRAAVETSAV